MNAPYDISGFFALKTIFPNLCLQAGATVAAARRHAKAGDPQGAD